MFTLKGSSGVNKDQYGVRGGSRQVGIPVRGQLHFSEQAPDFVHVRMKDAWDFCVDDDEKLRDAHRLRALIGPRLR